MKWKMIILLMFLVACAKPAVTDSSDVVKSEVAVEPVVDKKFDIAEAAQLGEPFKCVSTQAGQTVTIYMKGNKMRMDTLPVDAHGIYTEESMYTWQGNSGTVMSMDFVEKMSDSEQPKTKAEIVENAQKVDAKCEPAVVPDDLFVPPSDVEFKDLSEMMKQIEDIARNLQK